MKHQAAQHSKERKFAVSECVTDRLRAINCAAQLFNVRLVRCFHFFARVRRPHRVSLFAPPFRTYSPRQTNMHWEPTHGLIIWSNHSEQIKLNTSRNRSVQSISTVMYCRFVALVPSAATVFQWNSLRGNGISTFIICFILKTEFLNEFVFCENQWLIRSYIDCGWLKSLSSLKAYSEKKEEEEKQ